MNPKTEPLSQMPSVGTFVRYILVSVIFFHLFGLFGVFIAFAYPLLWFFFPGKTFCFYCLHVAITRPNGNCPVCRREVRTIYDPPLRSMFVNAVTILGLSFFAFTVIFLELTAVTQATRLNLARLFTREKANFILPEKYTYDITRPFPFDVQVRNMEKPINVVQADIEFDRGLVRVDRIETGDSFATIFTQKDFSNTEGWIRIVGGIPNPGFVGESGLFARIILTPVKTGAGEFAFLPSSRILANDGKGTNINASFPSQPVIITSGEVKGAADRQNAGIWEKLLLLVRGIIYK